MNRFSLICGFAIGLQLTSVVSAQSSNEEQQATEIPLDQIWAFQMPGTRDVRELDAEKKLAEPTKHPIVQAILNSLHRPPRDASPAFVVVGTGKQALENAKSVLMSRAEPMPVFPPNAELTLVFFSYIGGRYVHLDSVEQRGNSFVVKYVLVSHPTQQMTTHFALIPIGRLSEGDYNVEMQQLPPVDEKGESVEPVSNSRRIVCGNASFRVAKE